MQYSLDYCVVVSSSNQIRIFEGLDCSVWKPHMSNIMRKVTSKQLQENGEIRFQILLITKGKIQREQAREQLFSKRWPPNNLNMYFEHMRKLKN